MNFKPARLCALGFLLGLGPVFGQAYVATDLNVPTFTPTTGNGVSTPYQVGAGTLNSYSQALLWSGSVSSVTNLTPSGFRSANALGISGFATVGEGVLSTGQTVALYWPAPVPGSAVNLNPTIGSIPAALSVALGLLALLLFVAAGKPRLFRSPA
jgi:hypothetical protein